MKDTMNKLLDETREILQDQEQYLKSSGENFNIFSITKIERYENNTHSAMIAELLNPKGSHHQGKLFLKEFLKVITTKCFNENSSDRINTFIDQNITVNTEKHIGKISTIENQGGRIDIMISSNQSCFIIENKIDAIDQDRQLERYNNYPQEEKYILYLTLWGKDAPDSSAGNLKANKDYFPIAYKNEIVEWLENCIQKCKNEHVNHVIRQYLNLIKKITYQLENKYMDNLKTLLKTNLLEAEYIAKTLPIVVSKIQEDFRKKFKSKLSNKLPENLKIDESTNDGNIYIIRPNYTIHKLCFAVMFTNEPLYYGIYNHSGNHDNNKVVENHINNVPHKTMNFPFWDYLKDETQDLINLNNISYLEELINSFKEERVLNLMLNEVESFIKKYEAILL